ncbi:MAG: TonB-dependent receptor, partial [Bacteroidota bacterium]
MVLKRLIGIAFFLSSFGLLSVAAKNKGAQPLVEVLVELQEEYKVVFSYNSKYVKDITVQFQREEKETFESAINRALRNTGLKYKLIGLNFYVIYKDNRLNKQKLKKIKKKIRRIEKLGDNSDFIISNKKSLTKISAVKNLKKIQGKIIDESGEPMLGASILVMGTNYGTTSEADGTFELNIPVSANSLSVSYTGYITELVEIAGQQKIDIKLKEGLKLQSVTVFGSRGAPRTRFDSPVPIDHICLSALDQTGKTSLDEQLTQLVPSFNSGQHPVSDAAAHFNPVDLRGLLPSRTLVLVNGKRKNTSALLYSYVTASRGEVGVDLKSISSDAIKAVEVLRDGAAAQYGSDAIAGVINLELKEKIKPFINAGYSTTAALDGTRFNSSAGMSFDLSKKGFATFTLDYQQQNRSQRAGQITSVEDEAGHWGNAIFSEQDFENYLARNPRAGFQVGLPDTKSFNVSLNSRYTLNQATNTHLYAFGTLMNRRGQSPQYARGPYWVTGFEAIYPNQDYFLPEMAPIINDQSISLGLEHVWQGWKMDLSTSFGGNRIDYYIKNSFNQSLGSASPKDFYNGAHQFRHLVNNLDVNKTLHPTSVESLCSMPNAIFRLST